MTRRNLGGLSALAQRVLGSARGERQELHTGAPLGFFFAPSAYAESLPGKENANCMTVLKSLRLEITYLGKPQSFP